MTHHRLSWFNRIALLLVLIGVIVCIMRGQWLPAGVFALALIGMAWAAIAASRGRGSDRMRVDAAQPFDERERQIVRSGFAVVGQFAFLTQIALVIWQVASQGSTIVGECIRLIALSTALGIGNWWAKRQA
jgi:hypothetical protein